MSDSDDVLDRLLAKVEADPRPPTVRGHRTSEATVRARAENRAPAPLPSLSDDREPLFTAHAEAIFLRDLRLGGRLRAAARHAQLPWPLVKDWLERGCIEAEGWYRRFYMAVEQALGTAEMMFTGRVVKAGEDPRYWRANVTMMRARGWMPPDRGGVRVGIRHARRGGTPAPPAPSDPDMPALEGIVDRVPLDEILAIAVETE